MTFYFYILLFLGGITGTRCVTTVNKVSVNAGQTLSIPCRYEPQYRQNVKYLCKGYYWRSCSYAIKSNEPKKSKKFSISDDKDQRIFTVTFKDLKTGDTDFWCAVEIDGGRDVKQYFELSFTKDTPILNVKSQKITGVLRENISIKFQQRTSDNMKCCRLNGNCVTNPSGVIDRTRVTFEKMDPKVFTVTFSGLEFDSGGWYVCESRGYQKPVRVTVIESPTTAAATTGQQAVTSLENRNDSPLFDLQSLMISLSVLMAIVVVALIIWRLLKCKQAKVDASATANPSHSDSLAFKAEDEVMYSSVVHVNQSFAQRSHDEPKADVLYSTVVTKREPNAVISLQARSDDNVEYSSVIAGKRPTKKNRKGVEETIYSIVAEHS